MKKIIVSIPHISYILCLIVIGIVGCDSNVDTARKAFINYEWANNKLWDDGMAEVAKYEATRKVYNKTRSFEYTYILVKELFNKSFHVKSDNYQEDETYPVMKINKFCRIETSQYPYHYLTSLFIHRGNPEDLHKLTVTSQEWCGNTSKHFLEANGKYRMDYTSYFDGEGTGNTKVMKGPWFEDQLSYTLRSLTMEDGLSFDVELYPSQITNKAEIPDPENAHIEVVKATTDQLEEIKEHLIEDPWEVRVTVTSGKTMSYWINNTYPNYLLKMESSDGSSLSLQEIKRDAYWAHE